MPLESFKLEFYLTKNIKYKNSLFKKPTDFTIKWLFYNHVPHDTKMDLNNDVKYIPSLQVCKIDCHSKKCINRSNKLINYFFFSFSLLSLSVCTSMQNKLYLL